MPTASEIYDQTIKYLPARDREELLALILNDLAPDLPSTVRSREHLIELLQEGIDSLDRGDGIEITPQYWDDFRAELRERAIKRIPSANA